MQGSVVTNVRDLRQLKAWTQEELAGRSGVSVRQVIRVERGKSQPKPDTIAKLAAAFDTDPARLLHGRTAEELTEIAEANCCPVCGASLTQRVAVIGDYGDDIFEMFDCGATYGSRNQLCPKDPRFPAFADYEVVCSCEGETWYCWARGRTTGAQAVGLEHGQADSEEKARRLVERSYVAIKYGYEEASRRFPLCDLL